VKILLKLDDIHIDKQSRGVGKECGVDPRCAMMEGILVLKSLLYEVYGSLPVQAGTILSLAESGFTTALT
jgi:hypothetical protein